MRSIFHKNSFRRIFATVVTTAALLLAPLSVVAAPAAATVQSGLTSALGPAAQNQKTDHKVGGTFATFSQGPRRLQHTAGDRTGSTGTTSSGTSTPGEMSIASSGRSGTGSISGRVTTAPNVGVAASMVYAVSSEGDEYWAITNSQGNYTLTGLPASTYTINFDTSVVATAKNLRSGENRAAVNGRIVLKAQIKGQVTSASDASAIADIAVRAYSVTNENQVVAWTFTDASGNYFLHGLPAGSFKINFDSSYNTSGSFLPSWNSSQADFFTADALTLAASAVRMNVNQSLVVGSQISGTITEHSTNNPVQGLAVFVVDAVEQWKTLGLATTDAQGRYVVRHLPNGQYRIKFETQLATIGEYEKTWYSTTNFADSFATASLVSVSDAQRLTGINYAVNSAGSIAGKISNSTGAGVFGVNVEAYDSENQWAGFTTTDSLGNYKLRGVAPGTYKLHFATDYVSAGSFMSSWSGGASSQDSATVITVGNLSNVAGVNAKLAKAAQISGTIKNVAGAGIGGVYISAVGPNGEWDSNNSTQSAANGSYTLRGLPAGTFRIAFDTANSATGSYLKVWSGNKPTYETATKITVAQGATKSGVNAIATAAAQISGRIVSQSGVGIPGVSVGVFDAATSEGLPFATSTDSLGNFVVRGLPAGRYKLQYTTDQVSVGSFLSSAPVSVVPDAESIEVAAGQSKTAMHTTLNGGGTISSVVTTESGPVPGALFEAYSTLGDGSTAVARGTTDSLGRLAIRGLPMGAYRLHIDGSSVVGLSIASGWLWGTSFGDASPVTVTPGSESFVAITPSLVGSIFGRVINGGQQSIKKVQVDAYLSSDLETSIASATTDSRGQYVIKGLPNGVYKLRFSTYQVTSGNYMNQWLGDTVNNIPGGEGVNAASWSISDTTPLEASTVSLTRTAEISGTATTESGDPIAGLQVAAVDANDEGNFVQTVSTNALGQFDIVGLPAGSYKLRFDPANLPSANLRVTWNKEKASFAAAETLTVTWAQVLTGINSEVFAGAQIVGKITAKTGGKPVAGVHVVACPVSPGACPETITDDTGSYVIPALSAGSYRVGVDPTNATGSYLRQWWGGVGTIGDSTVVTFASRQVRTMNFQLVSGATVTGRVTAASSQGIEGVQVQVYSKTSETWLGGYAFTDAQGYFTLKGVPSGGVKLKFDADNAVGDFVSEWNNDKASYALADVVSLSVGQVKAAVNATLAAATWTSLQGNLPTGGAGATVEVFDSDEQLVKSVTADQSGHYVVSNLHPGTFRVKFTAVDVNCYGANWYVPHDGGARTFSQASDIVISDRSVTTLDNTTFEQLACA